MLTLDHIAVACETLDEGRAVVESALGAALEPGGKHARLGTHNMLMGLEDGIYFELIAIDPEAPDPGLRRWFDLDDFAGPPRLTNWICRTGDLPGALALAPQQMGAAMELTRGELRWMMAAGIDGRLPFGGAFPAIIDWGASPHPSTRLKPTGLRLERLLIASPEAEALRRALAPLIADARIVVEPGAPAMRAEFSSPAGRKVLE
ncbi:MAG: VOC family protein [Paracoccaceae bacterium]